MKIDSKTDKWKSDRALERIKNCLSYSEMHIFGYVINGFQSLSHGTWVERLNVCRQNPPACAEVYSEQNHSRT